MTAWQLYWILQLDSINSMFGWVMVISLLGAVLLCLLMIYACMDEEEDIVAKMKPWFLRLVSVAVSCLLIMGFLPSTKTAAAMVILPAIVNNQHVQQEANELYQLAKQALAHAASADKPAKKE